MKINMYSKIYGWHVVEIDDEDKPVFDRYNWYLSKGKKTYYLHYRQQKNNKKITLLFHRIVIKAAINEMVDHADNNGLNNRKNNLRIATIAQNNMNKTIHNENKSGFKGVIYYPKMGRKIKGRYRVQLMINRNKINGGYFDCPIEAAKKYNELALIHHKEFAHLNKIPQ